MRSRLAIGSLLALSATGCLATKGDMRLLQSELRAARASAARADSAHRRTSDSLAAELANLKRVQALASRDAQQSQQKTADDVKALAARVQQNDINTKEQLKALNTDVEQLRELTRQNSRASAFQRAQEEQARAAAAVVDTTTTSPAAPPAPGSATMLLSGRSLIVGGSCATGRRTFQDLLTSFPDSPDAPEALYLIAESYVACSDGASPAKADSVYQLVVERYPRSEFAATSLYKRAEALRVAGKAAEARPLYERIVCQYPKAQVFPQARARLPQAPRC